MIEYSQLNDCVVSLHPATVWRVWRWRGEWSSLSVPSSVTRRRGLQAGVYVWRARREAHWSPSLRRTMKETGAASIARCVHACMRDRPVLPSKINSKSVKFVLWPACRQQLSSPCRGPYFLWNKASLSTERKLNLASYSCWLYTDRKLTFQNNNIITKILTNN